MLFRVKTCLFREYYHRVRNVTSVWRKLNSFVRFVSVRFGSVKQFNKVFRLVFLDSTSVLYNALMNKYLYLSILCKVAGFLQFQKNKKWCTYFGLVYQRWNIKKREKRIIRILNSILFFLRDRYVLGKCQKYIEWH